MKITSCILALFILWAPCSNAWASSTVNPEQPSEFTPTQEAQDHSWGHKILWYVPNRVLDFFDIFRLRIRFGPGLAGNARMTSAASAFGGSYNTVYVGLPGPREEAHLRSPVGREQWKGIYFMGIDATDDTPHNPGYSVSECDLGAQLLVVGAEAGVDPVEFVDFLAGFFFMGLRKDDL
jgi:hypothetical protein